MTFSSRMPLALAIGLLGACSPTPPASAPAPGETEAAITAADLQHRVAFLASDALRGREIGSPGLRDAANYIAGELARLGLRPAGDDGGYLQAVPLERSTTRATVALEQNGTTRSLGTDEILSVSGLGGLPDTRRTEGSGPLIYAGHLVDPEVGAAELDPSSLSGAVLIVRLDIPEGVDPQTAQPRMTLASAFSPMSPVAAILLVAEGTDDEFWDYAGEITSHGLVALPSATPAISGNPPPFFLISTDAAERMIGGPLATARLPKTDLGRVTFDVQKSVEEVDAWNVAAVLPGRDPARAGEYVALGAHYDHVGVGEPVDGDSIYNGADDNASGSSGLLEVAEAMASLPMNRRPARSVFFVWNTGEESGLLGSEFFTDHPTIPRDDIVSYVNIDMIGRNGADSLYVVGSRRISTELGDLLEEVNSGEASPFTFDYTFDTPGHPEHIYCRSDHYNFARYGVPIIFLTTGLHDQYHQPSDEMDLLDYAKMQRVSTLLFDVVTELADRPTAPVVDQVVPPLGTPCE